VFAKQTYFWPNPNLMKNLFSLLIILALCMPVLAQSPTGINDVILKVNGEEIQGRVTKVSEETITFVYPGETAEYTIKKSDVLKITHSSGRVEMISQPLLPSQARKNDRVAITATPADRHNKIAVLPFTYLLDHQDGAVEVGLQAQQEAFAYLSKHAAGYTVLDPRTTNALLIKAGVTKDKMMGFTMKEIGDVLGVEYIVEGSIAQTKSAQTSYNNQYANTTIRRNNDDRVKGVNTSSSGFGTASQQYDVTVSLEIYMDNNASIYNQSHRALFANTSGAYSAPLNYLLKRSPLAKN